MVAGPEAGEPAPGDRAAAVGIRARDGGRPAGPGRTGGGALAARLRTCRAGSGQAADAGGFGAALRGEPTRSDRFPDAQERALRASQRLPSTGTDLRVGARDRTASLPDVGVGGEHERRSDPRERLLLPERVAP